MMLKDVLTIPMGMTLCDNLRKCLVRVHAQRPEWRFKPHLYKNTHSRVIGVTVHEGTDQIGAVQFEERYYADGKYRDLFVVRSGRIYKRRDRFGLGRECIATSSPSTATKAVLENMARQSLAVRMQLETDAFRVWVSGVVNNKVSGLQHKVEEAVRSFALRFEVTLPVLLLDALARKDHETLDGMLQMVNSKLPEAVKAAKELNNVENPDSLLSSSLRIDASLFESEGVFLVTKFTDRNTPVERRMTPETLPDVVMMRYTMLRSMAVNEGDIALGRKIGPDLYWVFSEE